MSLILSGVAYADGECQRRISGEGSYQEIFGKFGTSCITSDGDHVVLRLLAGDGKGKWINNAVLVGAQELNSGVVSLVNSNGVNLIFEYPRDIYLVGFDLGKKVILSARHILRIPSVDPEEIVVEIELRTKQEILNGVGLESVDKNILFGKSSLELARPQVVGISSRKAILRKMPGGETTGMYLIKGDKVKLLKYKEGWVQLEYLTAKGRRISMWTELSNVL